MDGLSYSASFVAIASLAMQANDELRRINEMTSGIEFDESSPVTTLHNLQGLTSVLSNIAADNATSSIVFSGSNSESAQKCAELCLKGIEALQSSARRLATDIDRFVGKGKSTREQLKTLHVAFQAFHGRA
ncbi:hypothetical protein BDZ45DRAFT_309802 [Acephala macrosclerotiorum]|nr:hypothetical protein BDZ45DRAFT_309802 [Acephala macrosclerotiorum]